MDTFTPPLSCQLELFRTDAGGFQLLESLAPRMDGLLTDLVLLRELGHRRAIRLPQECDHRPSVKRLYFIGSLAGLRGPFSQLVTGPENLGRSDGIQRNMNTTTLPPFALGLLNQNPAMLHLELQTKED